MRSRRTSASRAGPSAGAEPAQLGAELLCPPGIQDRPRRAQERSCASGRDSHLVEILGIDAQARARVVIEQVAVLLHEREPECLTRGSVRGNRAGLAFDWEIERPEELRREPVLRRARSAQHALEAPERSLVAVDELDLDLAKSSSHPLRLEDRDGVLHDLSAVLHHDLTAGTQTRHLDERLFVVEVGHEEGGHLGRAAGRALREPRARSDAPPRGS